MAIYEMRTYQVTVDKMKDAISAYSQKVGLPKKGCF